MPETTHTQPAAEPMTLADLRLPPVFVTDHCIRTLFYQGAMSPVDLANHWRVHPDIAVEAVDSLKAAGLIEVESGQSTFERLGRVRLNSAGQAYVAQARSRTWYAGPLPVSLETFERLTADAATALTRREGVRAALAPFHLEDSSIDEIGQAMAGGATIALAGVAPDEQPAFAAALGRALDDAITVPYAVYAAGAVIRLFDRRSHRAIERAPHGAGSDTDVLRTHNEDSQWTRIERPVLALAGGVLPSDVLPAYDEDARFYLAPTPFKACGGLLAILDGAANPEALGDLARLWLVPGRHGTGILLLRSGERIEVPWRASTVIFGASGATLPDALRDTLAYRIDVGPLTGTALRGFLAQRFAGSAIDERACEIVASALEHWDLTRLAAAQASRYILDRARYEGDAFVLTDELAERAAAFGCSGPVRALRRVA